MHNREKVYALHRTGQRSMPCTARSMHNRKRSMSAFVCLLLHREMLIHHKSTGTRRVCWGHVPLHKAHHARLVSFVCNALTHTGRLPWPPHPLTATCFRVSPAPRPRVKYGVVARSPWPRRARVMPAGVAHALPCSPEVVSSLAPRYAAIKA